METRYKHRRIGIRFECKPRPATRNHNLGSSTPKETVAPLTAPGCLDGTASVASTRATPKVERLLYMLVLRADSGHIDRATAYDHTKLTTVDENGKEVDIIRWYCVKYRNRPLRSSEWSQEVVNTTNLLRLTAELTQDILWCALDSKNCCDMQPFRKHHDDLYNKTLACISEAGKVDLSARVHDFRALLQMIFKFLKMLAHTFNTVKEARRLRQLSRMWDSSWGCALWLRLHEQHGLLGTRNGTCPEWTSVLSMDDYKDLDDVDFTGEAIRKRKFQRTIQSFPVEEPDHFVGHKPTQFGEINANLKMLDANSGPYTNSADIPQQQMDELPKPGPNKSLYVSNIGLTVTEKDLWVFFNVVPGLTHCQLLYKRTSLTGDNAVSNSVPNHAGSAKVTYNSTAFAGEAIRTRNNLTLLYTPIRMQFWNDRVHAAGEVELWDNAPTRFLLV